MNWDGVPGADGLEVRLHLFQYSRQLPVTVKGSLEFLLYEGVVRPGEFAKARLYHTWRFGGQALQAHLGRSAVGWGYAMRLDWTDRPPT